MPPFPLTGMTRMPLIQVPLRDGEPPIRGVIRLALAMAQLLPSHYQVGAVTKELREYIGRVAPDVAEAARRRGDGDPACVRVLADVEEAQRRARHGSAGDGYLSAIRYAVGLAESAEALLRHQEGVVDGGDG
ncbi:DUF6415 family natural product biosynthesis protein [Streptomyces gamaensis]|uniref:DUF6415 family natural product biosynthesis protein n=1 Tax=Streptomyces gamaensis TaxID=1763542 RepID=A0ABW0YPV0_9ACTN